MATFLILTGWFFFSTFFLFNQAELRNFFSLLPFIFAFIVPAMTMRLFSEEYNTGSFELLMTMPLTRVDIITGKFFASTACIALMLFPTLSYAISISLIGELDKGPVIGGYMGALLLGGAFAAIGTFSSSLTKNQIIAFIVGMSICFSLALLDKMLPLFPEWAVGVLQYLSADYHFKNISRGILDTRDILYFLSVSFVSLYGANLVIENRK